MCRLVQWVLLISLIVALPTWADEPPSEKDPPKSPPKPAAETPKYQIVSTATGKLTDIDTKAQTITIEQRVLSSPKSKTTKAVKTELSYAADVKVRTLKLPPKFDENNKEIPYKDKEKADLRGNDPKVPGFASDISRVAEGQMVQVDLGIHKPPPGAPKKKDKDVAVEKPTVIMIVIQVEEPKRDKKPDAKPEKKSKEK